MLCLFRLVRYPMALLNRTTGYANSAMTERCGHHFGTCFGMQETGLDFHIYHVLTLSSFAMVSSRITNFDMG